MNYVTLVEHNDWEGESWTFYVQLDGNEEALMALAAAIVKHEMQEEYELDLTPVSECMVSYWTRRSSSDGYMASCNKVDGTLDPSTLVNLSYEELNQLLYKGGIRDMLMAKKGEG